MRILICSDGTPESGNATRLGSLLVPAADAGIALLGIAEEPGRESSLRQTLEQQADALRQAGAKLEVALKSGEPIAQIVAETTAQHYDLALIGARGTANRGLFWRSRRMYEVIKAVQPPVLVALGGCQQLRHFLVCTGGKRYIDAAVRLTGKLAFALQGEVTLLHVMAEPPAIYADLVQKEEDVEALLHSRSELGRNLAAQKQRLEKAGVKTNIRIRHGLVLEQVFEELDTGRYDAVVSGSSRARGPLRHYIMGDLTRGILNRAECPVLVARSRLIAHHGGGFFSRLRAMLASK